MLDYFALLNVPRRPWLDVERLKQNFFALSGAVHPDRAHNGSSAEKAEAQRKFTELNAAWQCLREPKDRLGHLLELETGARPGDTNEVPEAAMDLFLEVGKVCREADAFLAAKSKIKSPLLLAGMIAEGMGLTGRLQELLGRIESRHEALLSELRERNAAWDTAPRLDALAGMCRMFGYIARWRGQIQERVARLSF